MLTAITYAWVFCMGGVFGLALGEFKVWPVDRRANASARLCQGCAMTPLHGEQVMCESCWRLVPPSVRADIAEAWKRAAISPTNSERRAFAEQVRRGELQARLARGRTLSLAAHIGGSHG